MKRNGKAAMRRMGWQEKYTDWLLYGAIAAALMALLLVFGGKKSFFSDEMDQVGILASSHSLWELLRLYASVGHEVAPPLFAALAWCWYQLVPHTQAWLQALPALLTCGGVYAMGLAGRALGGRVTGALAAALALAAPTVTLTAGMQLRQYGALLLFAALTTYLYARLSKGRAGTEDPWGLLLLYGVCMALLPYTHYVSVLLPVWFGIADLYGVIKKRIRPRRLIAYALGAALFLPWLAAILSSVAGRTEFWLDKPRINDLIATLYFLTDGSGPGLLFYLFVAGGSVALSRMLTRRTGGLAPGEEGEWTPRTGQDSLALTFALAPLFMMGCIFVYSAYFSKDISLYLDRYFIGAVPSVLLTAAYGIKGVMDVLLLSASGQREGARRRAALALWAFFAVVALLRAEETIRTDVNTLYEPYREAADWLMEQPDIHDADVAVVTSNLSAYVTLGWETLYVTRDGERQAFLVYDYVDQLTEEGARQYRTIYTFVEHAALPASAQAVLEEGYVLDEGCVSGLAYGVCRYVRAMPER